MLLCRVEVPFSLRYGVLLYALNIIVHFLMGESVISKISDNTSNMF